jgi:hypothetical protein
MHAVFHDKLAICRITTDKPNGQLAAYEIKFNKNIQYLTEQGRRIKNG